MNPHYAYLSSPAFLGLVRAIERARTESEGAQRYLILADWLEDCGSPAAASHAATIRNSRSVKAFLASV